MMQINSCLFIYRMFDALGDIDIDLQLDVSFLQVNINTQNK